MNLEFNKFNELKYNLIYYREEFTNELKSDDCKIIQLDDGVVGWVSFLDGLQRILLFTEDVNLCCKVSF